MKTINELRQEICLVRKDLAKMNERLLKVDTELMAFKDSLQEDTNYKHIFDLAEVMPIFAHPVVSMQQRQKSIYLGILLFIATLEDSISEQQLLFMQRIIMKDDNRQRIDYYMGNLGRIQPDNVIFCLDDEKIMAHANQLLLDMIVIAKLGKNCTVRTYGVIADIASFMGIKKLDFMEICKVAVSVITQDCSHLTENVVADIRLDKEYGYYLEKLPTWKKRVEKAKRQSVSSGELLGYGIYLI